MRRVCEEREEDYTTSQIFFHTYYILFIAYKKTINLSDPSCFTPLLFLLILLTVPFFSNVI
jgi:hypothetical protein